MNNFSIRWKLVFVAAIALALAAGSAPASAQAPAIEIAPQGRSAERPPAWTDSSIKSTAKNAKKEASPSRSSRSSRFSRTPFHTAQPISTDQARRLSPGAIIGLICAIAASSVALGIAFGLRRRIDRIAGPDPDKTDDD